MNNTVPPVVKEQAITLTGAQVLQALDFIAPDRDTDPQQLEGDLTIAYGDGHAGKGYYCWLTDYPDEGSTLLDAEASDAPATPVDAEPVANDLGPIRVGRLPTMNQDEYPGLGDWWVQLRIGSEGDEVLARVYGDTPEQAHSRAAALAAPFAAQAVEPKLDKPAKVGGCRFGAGIKWSTVIQAAQRLYEYEVTPEKEAERIAGADQKMQALRHHIAAQAQQDADKEDAERYRYLRGYRGHKATGVLLKGILFNGHESMARTDEVIDVARKEQA